MSELCGLCAEEYETVWTASGTLWRRVTGLQDRGGLRCPSCFGEQAKEKGIRLFWECGESAYPSKTASSSASPELREAAKHLLDLCDGSPIADDAQTIQEVLRSALARANDREGKVQALISASDHIRYPITHEVPLNIDMPVCRIFCAALDAVAQEEGKDYEDRT